MSDLIRQENGLSINENIEEFRKRMQGFTKILNSKPDPKKILKHQGYEYIPISAIEKDLDKLYFGLVQYECISFKQIFNEVACHARIKVFHPVINQWMHYDGLGSAVLQQDKDTKVSDFHLFKKPNAGQLTYPKAYAEAIKNAAKKIGKRFGADINRTFEDNYEPLNVSKKPLDKEDDRLYLLIQDCNTEKELRDLEKHIPETLTDAFNVKMDQLRES